jgi:DNA-directed RNA polymerase subunit RPC12/RpoP
MAIINCAECGKEISDKSEQCIGCGAPITPEENQNKFEEIACPECEVKNSLDALTCISCGYPISTDKNEEEFREQSPGRRHAPAAQLPDENIYLDDGLYLAEVNKLTQSDSGRFVEIRDENGDFHHVSSEIKIEHKNSAGSNIIISPNNHQTPNILVLKVGELVSFTPTYKDGKLNNLNKIHVTDIERFGLEFSKNSGVLIQSSENFKYLQRYHPARAGRRMVLAPSLTETNSVGQKATARGDDETKNNNDRPSLVTITEFIDSVRLEETIVTNCRKYRSKFLNIVEKSGVGRSNTKDTEAIKTIMSTRSWNWAALLFNTHWAIYRKVNSLGWGLFTFGWLLLIISMYVPALETVGNILPWGVAIVVAMYGNSYVLRNSILAYENTTLVKDREQRSPIGLAVALIIDTAIIVIMGGLIYEELI